MPEWISVTASLPELDQPVHLAQGDCMWVGARTETGDGWLWGNCYGSQHFDGTAWKCGSLETDDDYQPTHWQALPSLPAGVALPDGSQA